ncbi:hypothetical protein BJ508DRAFT_419596 [Ascobolus immersus RN42]|uniref:Mitochondrial carrier n=1 Tax=Ascobolus immersus RN42 TaxID=1160509 RepID=A0A3N4HGG8_ASCIM|nr:hypothetical protein BJ508DRAFT_419596 [Ascobolus immersus RN42]
MEAPPNPLRPYYNIPRDIPAPTNTTTSLPTRSSFPSLPVSASPSYFDDATADWNVSETLTSWAQTGLLKYTIHSVSQPFENACLLLQVRVATGKEKKKKIFVPELDDEFSQESEDETKNIWDDSKSDSDSDTPYFSDQLPTRSKKSSTTPSKPRRLPTTPSGYVVPPTTDDTLSPPHHLTLPPSPGIISVIRSTYDREGLLGIWKSNNATFLYTLLFETIQPYTSSLLSALVGLPEYDLSTIADADAPLVAVGTIVASFAITSLVLAPLDIARIKLILTPINSKGRGLWPTLKSLPSGFICPPSLILPTTLHAISTSLFSYATPVLSKRYLGVPMNSLLDFASTNLQVLFEMPAETILRRGQVDASKPERTVVPVGRYAGMLGTVWALGKEEGGVSGLYRGWRMVMWRNGLELVAGMLGGGDMEEF